MQNAKVAKIRKVTNSMLYRTLIKIIKERSAISLSLPSLRISCWYVDQVYGCLFRPPKERSGVEAGCPVDKGAGSQNIIPYRSTLPELNFFAYVGDNRASPTSS